MTILGACNNGEGSKSSSEDSRRVLEDMGNELQQQSFRFDGSSSLRGDNFSHENIVNFTGIVGKDRNTYLNLKTAQEENGVVEDMDLYAKGDQIYIRFADQVDWEPISEPSPLVEMEINHWNPIAHLQRMQTMSEHVEYIGGKNNIESIRVVLDSEALKNDFLNNIRARMMEKDSPGKKDMLRSLSTGQAGEQGVLEEIEGLYDALKQDFAELERSIGIRGEYTIHYDKVRKLPTRITYTQTTDYSQDGRNETEISATDITLTRYGENRIPTDTP